MLYLSKQHIKYTPSLHIWWSAPDSHDHMLLNTGQSRKERNREEMEREKLFTVAKKIINNWFLQYYYIYSTVFILVPYFFISLHNGSWITSCHVETNHWTFRCFWQRLRKQDSWLTGFGRPAHKLSGSVCVWTPGLVLVHSTVLFFKPLPHLREHCEINRKMIMIKFDVLKCLKRHVSLYDW